MGPFNGQAANQNNGSEELQGIPDLRPCPWRAGGLGWDGGKDEGCMGIPVECRIYMYLLFWAYMYLLFWAYMYLLFWAYKLCILLYILNTRITSRFPVLWYSLVAFMHRSYCTLVPLYSCTLVHPISVHTPLTFCVLSLSSLCRPRHAHTTSAPTTHITLHDQGASFSSTLNTLLFSSHYSFLLLPLPYCHSSTNQRRTYSDSADRVRATDQP